MKQDTWINMDMVATRLTSGECLLNVPSHNVTNKECIAGNVWIPEWSDTS